MNYRDEFGDTDAERGTSSGTDRLTVYLLGALLLIAIGTNAFLNYRTSQAVERLHESVESQTNQTWEYKCVETNRETAFQEVGTEEHLDERFSAYGLKGWELVGYAMNNGANVRHVCFKRPAS